MSSKSSKSDQVASLPDTVIVGRVRKPHGVRGEVVVEVLSDVGSRFDIGSEVRVTGKESAARGVRITAVRRRSNEAIVRFEGFEDRDQAQELRGAVLEVSTDEVPEAPPGSYYFFELVGCVCEDKNAGELGLVERVLEDGGGLVLEIRKGTEKVLVPFVETYLTKIDRNRRRIEVDLPEGLIEACTSRF